MSNLLLDEYPLIVLPSLACRVGLNAAIVLQQVHFWQGKSTKIKEGHAWFYKTYQEWRLDFPWWGLHTIRRAIGQLESAGLVISTSKFNKLPSDQTKWYRVDYDALEALSLIEPVVQLGQGGVQLGQLGVSNLDRGVSNLDRGGVQLGHILPETTTQTPSQTTQTEESLLRVVSNPVKESSLHENGSLLSPEVVCAAWRNVILRLDARFPGFGVGVVMDSVVRYEPPNFYLPTHNYIAYERAERAALKLRGELRAELGNARLELILERAW